MIASQASVLAPLEDPYADAAPVQLIAFDVDGTLVEHDDSQVVWQVLHRRFGGDPHINEERFRAYIKGEMTYAEWVRLDIEGWIAGGATREGIEKAIFEELRLVPHARTVLRTLCELGYTVAVVSGTLDLVLDLLFPDHPFAHVFTNRIRFDEAGAISSWAATPYDMEGKAEALRTLATQLGLEAHNVAFVGDNLNDCAALSWVGCPIVYDPKHEQVRRCAHHVLPRGRLDLLLDLFAPRSPRA